MLADKSAGGCDGESILGKKVGGFQESVVKVPIPIQRKQDRGSPFPAELGNGVLQNWGEPPAVNGKSK